ncbi:MAG: hypothetical protein U0K91_10590, partial [Acutalibacteraceae bacterium]|nr:hypothetical protein [Acutalibacteraceae bacterium]
SRFIFITSNFTLSEKSRLFITLTPLNICTTHIITNVRNTSTIPENIFNDVIDLLPDISIVARNIREEELPISVGN